MKKLIIIEEQSTKDELIKNKTLNFIITLVCNAIVLVLVSLMFKSFYISNKFFGLYAVIAALIITILNKTIKPVLIVLTLPISILSMGLLYPIVNMIILYITSFLMGNNFNIFMDGLVVKPMMKKE